MHTFIQFFSASAHPILKSSTSMIPIPWSHRGSKPLTLTWKKTSLGSFFLLHAEHDFSLAWFYINKQIPHEDRFFSTPSQTDKDLLESLRSSRVWRNVSFPCYHRHLKCWLILTFPALFLWHSTVAVSGHNVLAALAKVLQLTVHRFFWHSLTWTRYFLFGYLQL